MALATDEESEPSTENEPSSLVSWLDFLCYGQTGYTNLHSKTQAELALIACTLTTECCAFSMVGSHIWNGLPLGLHALEARDTYTFTTSRTEAASATERYIDAIMHWYIYN